VEIPTDERQPSMNLGQAVAVCLYELAGRGQTLKDPQAEVCGIPPFRQEDYKKQVLRLAQEGHPALEAGPDGPGLCPNADPGDLAGVSGDLELLAGVVEEVMLAAKYSPASMREANRHDLRLLLRRLSPSVRDTRRILGLFRRILWRLRRGQAAYDPKGKID